MNLKEQINANIRDKVSIIEVGNIKFYWKFSMGSMYDLLNDFGYENEHKLMNALRMADSRTLAEIFYVGIVWDDEDEKPTFKEFLLFLGYNDIVDTIKDFLSEKLPLYLPNPYKDSNSKKKPIQ